MASVKINDNTKYDANKGMIICSSSSTHYCAGIIAQVFGGMCTFTSNNTGFGAIGSSCVQFSLKHIMLNNDGKSIITFTVHEFDGKNIATVLDIIDDCIKHAHTHDGRTAYLVNSDVLSRSAVYAI